MRPRFLLDEHLQPELAAAAVRAGLDAVAVCATALKGKSDLAVLLAAIDQDRIVVTYDAEDFRPLVSGMTWLESRFPALFSSTHGLFVPTT